MANLKDFLTQPLFKTESTRAGVLVVAGGYVLYLAYDMVKAVLADETAVSKVPALLAAGVLAVGGIGIVIYAGRRFWIAYKEEQKKAEEAAEEK